MKKIQLKMKALKWSQHCKLFFQDAQGQITPEFILGSGQNLNSFKLSCMSSLPARMKMIQSNMNGLEWSQHFSHYKSGDFSRCSRTANSTVLGPIWPNFKLIRDVMNVLVTCKNEDDPIKNEGARMFTTLYINFSDAQGQVTPESVMVSGQNLNSSKLLERR